MNTLALILAAGESSRISHLLNKEQPVKAMIKIGDKMLIDFMLEATNSLNAVKAVLTYPAPEYEKLDKILKERKLNVIKQHAQRRKLPTLLELPYILVPQYHASPNRGYLRQFDSIMTLPCDLDLKNVDLNEMVNLHFKHLRNPGERQVTILSKRSISGGRADLFKMEGDRIVAMESYDKAPLRDFEATTQAGIYIFSKGILKNPLPILLKFKAIRFLRCLTEGDWIDYGNPENIKNSESYVPLLQRA